MLCARPLCDQLPNLDVAHTDADQANGSARNGCMARMRRREGFSICYSQLRLAPAQKKTPITCAPPTSSTTRQPQSSRSPVLKVPHAWKRCLDMWPVRHERCIYGGRMQCESQPCRVELHFPMHHATLCSTQGATRTLSIQVCCSVKWAVQDSHGCMLLVLHPFTTSLAATYEGVFKAELEPCQGLDSNHNIQVG